MSTLYKENHADKDFVHRSLYMRAQAYDEQLNLSEELEWDEPKGDEVW